MKILGSTFVVLFFCLIGASGSVITINASTCEQEYSTDCKSGCSRTFFRPRPFSQDSVLENAMHYYDLHHRYKNDMADKEAQDTFLTFQHDFFYYHSTNRNDLAQYFLPKCQNCISIEQSNDADISSPWLGIISERGEPIFRSNVTIRPQREAFGGTAKLHLDLGGFIEKLWASAFIPVVYVRHRINFKEFLPEQNFGSATGLETVVQEVQKGVVPGLRDACDAFNNKEWCYSVIPRIPHSKVGADDILLRLGYDFYEKEDKKMGVFGMVFVPTGYSSNAEIMFEPTLGNGGHIGVGGGFHGHMLAWEDDRSDVTLMTEFRYAYFLKDKETRAFDHCNGEWSRYLVLALERAPLEHVLGPNYFVGCFDVKPRSMVDWWAALHYHRDRLNFEFGYNLWWRQKEELKFCQLAGVTDSVVILDMRAVQTSSFPSVTSASNAIISEAIATNGDIPLSPLPASLVSDATVTPITEKDYNIASATHCRSLSSKLYASASFDMSFRGCPSNTGFGLSYEISHGDAALSQVGLWWAFSVQF